MRSDNEQRFVRDMCRRLVHGGEPTKQAQLVAKNLRAGAVMATITKPKTYCGDLEHLSAALQPLTKEKRWLVWDWKLRTAKDGTQKWTKPPLQVRDPRRLAKSNDPKTWGPFSTALALVLARRVAGIGFALANANVAAVDIDKVRDPNSGLTTPWAEELINESQQLGCYIEITPSGTGYRIIGRAVGGPVQRKFTLDRKINAAIEIYRNTERYITISALEVGQCIKLPLIDNFIDALIARYDSGAAGDELFDLNQAESQKQTIDYDDLIKNGAPKGGRSDLFHSVIGHLYSQGLSEEDMIEELGRHPNGIAAKYAGRLRKEVHRCYAKWQNKKRARATGQGGTGQQTIGQAGTSQTSGTTTSQTSAGQAASGGTTQRARAWPQIRIVAGELPRVVDEAESALLASGHELYQRGGLIVRPVPSTLKAANNRETLGWRLVQLDGRHTIELMSRAARFWKYNERKKGFVVTDAPVKIAETYLAREGYWRLPILTGIVNVPFLRSDGSLCEQPGYDPASGLVFKPTGTRFPAIPSAPTRDDAVEALAQLNELIDTFPFVTAADRAVAFSAILTPVDRHALSTAPLHAFSSPVAGTGKSLLVDVVAILTTGRLMPVISQGENEEELEKRLSAALLAGDVVVSLDNCDRELCGGFLCQALTQQTLNIRLLGYSRNIETLNNASIFATGNNLTIASDLTRRVLLCTLDARCERPETRTFTVDPIAIARAERGRLVAASLTVLRAWHCADQEEEGAKLKPLGSYEDWSQRIRQALVWLDQADPCETTDDVRKNDPERQELYAVMAQWREHLGVATPFTVQQVIGHAVVEAEFNAALMAVAASRNGTGISNKELGRWLKRIERKVVGGYQFVQHGISYGYPLWKLLKP